MIKYIALALFYFSITSCVDTKKIMIEKFILQFHNADYFIKEDGSFEIFQKNENIEVNENIDVNEIFDKLYSYIEHLDFNDKYQTRIILVPGTYYIKGSYNNWSSSFLFLQKVKLEKSNKIYDIYFYDDNLNIKINNPTDLNEVAIIIRGTDYYYQSTTIEGDSATFKYMRTGNYIISIIDRKNGFKKLFNKEMFISKKDLKNGIVINF